MTDGDLESINVLMKDEEGKSQLRITQRLRLDQVITDVQCLRILKISLRPAGQGILSLFLVPSERSLISSKLS